MSVQVKEAQLRESPSFLGKITANLKYGDRVTVIEEQLGWWKVQGSPEQAGWLHSTALTPKKIVLQAGADVSTSASGEDVVVAGKGFNQQVETTYRNAYPALGYRWIDEMEKQRATAEEVAKFLQEGALKPGTGGGQ